LIVVTQAVSYGAMPTLLLLLALQSAPPRQASGQAPRQSSGQAGSKVEIVSVTGCLKEATPDNWTLTAATDPVPSSANAPAAKELPSAPPMGRNAFRLIGVSEFNLPAHRDHTVVIKGLLIKAKPVDRLNMTSVTAVSPSCAAATK
jgi:hypothetical protein